MRLHSLSVSAFGPFAGTETVDFDALGADGLFLLHGATGAGKTTVLDAVAFALFGRIPGARQDPDGRRLMSDHAPAGAVPTVELELSVGGRRVRVRRSPEYHRRKKRGVGTTREQARATLTWCDGAHQGAARPDEVGRAVESLLGMSADQFFQVVLLPQGAFATFLRADTAERAMLLATLFDTHRFADAEGWLAEHRKSTRAAVDAASRTLEVLVGQLQTASGAAGTPAEALGDPERVLEWARALSADATDIHVSAQRRLEQAREAEATARAAVADGQGRLDALIRRDAADAEFVELHRGHDEYTAWTQDMSAAGRAAGVRVAAESLDGARAVVATGQRVYEQLSGVVAADPEGAAALADERTGGGGLDAAVEAVRAEVGRLVELTTLSTVTEADDVLAVELHATVEGLTWEVAAIDTRRAELPEKLAAAAAAVVAAQQAADSLDRLSEDLGRARDVAAAAAEIPTRRAEHDATAESRTLAVGVHLRAKEHWLDLRERRLSGMAAELAGELRVGQPCGVCGAVEHPRPAQPSADRVTGAQERTAHEAEQAADAHLGAAATALAQAHRRLDDAVARGGGLAADVAEKQLADAETAHRRARGLAVGLEAARQRGDAVTAESDDLTRRERDLRHALSSARTELDGVRRRVADARERLSAARGADPDVPTRRARLHALAEEMQRLLAARADLESAQRSFSTQEQRLRAAAEDAGFSSGPELALAAVRSETEVRVLREKVSAHEHRRAVADAALAEPAIRALAGLDRAAVDADLLRLRQGAEEAGQALGVAQGEAATTGRCATEVAALFRELTSCVTGLVPQLARASEIAALADVVAGNGQNSRRMSLHSYVLAARLEEVAAAASIRLRRMSGGRYELRHSDALGPNGRRGGLGLDVLDDHTGLVRSTKTLSGGESFLASLSLALGLADVVAAEAGGVVLDTLFIDEGFGTLDPATLDEVMGVLDELRAGGRVVGLVSHVDELRQRIPTRLHVTATRTGSHLVASTA